MDRDLSEAKNRVRALETELDAAAQEKIRFQRDVKDNTRAHHRERDRSDDPAKVSNLASLIAALQLTTSLLDATNASCVAALLPGLQNLGFGFEHRSSTICRLDPDLEVIEKRVLPTTIARSARKTSKVQRPGDQNFQLSSMSLWRRLWAPWCVSPTAFSRADRALSNVGYDPQQGRISKRKPKTSFPATWSVDKNRLAQFLVLLLSAC